MNRWPQKDVQAIIAQPLPPGIVDLWNAVPSGYTPSRGGGLSLAYTNQKALVQSLGVIEQKAIAAAGSSVGFRPELFGLIKDLPAVNVLTKAASIVAASGLDLGVLSDATKKVLTDVVAKVGKATGSAISIAAYSSAVTAIVAVVWQAVKIIDQQYEAYQAAERESIDAQLDCKPLAFSAPIDEATVQEVIETILPTPNWERIFLPEVRPVSVITDGPDKWVVKTGFTCCPSTVDRGRVIAPVGIGIGNRQQQYIGGSGDGWSSEVGYYGSGPGFGCLPMCTEVPFARPGLPVHRAIIVPGGGGRIYDPAEALPLLAGLGIQVWHMLWTGGPATFTVDGRLIADAWANYFQTMREQIAFNLPGFGTPGRPDESNFFEAWFQINKQATPSVCDNWPQKDRSRTLAWLYERIGVDPRAANPDEGIYNFAWSSPARWWRDFEIYQLALLGYDAKGKKVGPPRLVAAYVDARTCHPAWRRRVKQAQRELLDLTSVGLGPAVCRMEVDSIADQEYRAEVEARRKQRGPMCYAVAGRNISNARVSATEGPSLIPLGEGSPKLPTIPIPAKPARAQRTPPRSSKAVTTVAVTAGLAGLGFLLLRR